MEKLRFLFFLLLPMVILANTGEKSLWDHVVKMEQVVLSVELNGRHLKVWKENSHGYNRFYVTPLCIIDTSLINCTKDDYSNEPRYVFSFFVRLWDSLAAETVRLALKQKDIEAKASDILPLPMQLIRLKISNNVRNNIEVDSEWRSNQDQPNTVLFEMYTKSHGFCNKMLQDAKNNPQTFLSRTKLTFEFSMLIGQQTYRSLNITGNTIGKSKAFSNLENNYSNQEGIVYLNSDDMNSLVRNIYQEIAISEEVDSNYIPSNQETQIIEELLGIFKVQTVQSNDLSTNEWNSVFWDDIFSRPDIQTEYFNEVLTYDQGEKEFTYDHDKDQQFRSKIEGRNSKQSQTSSSDGGGFSYAGFGLNLSGSSSDSNSNFNENVENKESDTNDRMALEDIVKFIRKNNANVKWSGTKFEPKGLLLYRLNTRNLKTKGEILYKRIVSTKLTSTQKIEIRPEPKYTTDLKNTISPIYFEDLDKNISELSTNLSNQISTQIQDTKTEFHQNLIKEIGNLNNSLKVNVDNLNTAINTNVHNLKHAHNVLHHYTHNDLKNWVAAINKFADGINAQQINILKRLENTESRLSGTESRLSGTERKLSSAESRLSRAENKLYYIPWPDTRN